MNVEFIGLLVVTMFLGVAAIVLASLWLKCVWRCIRKDK